MPREEGTVKITVPPKDLPLIEDFVFLSAGVSLAELVEQDARRAYALLSRYALVQAAGANRVWKNEDLIASRLEDGQEAAASLAAHNWESTRPDADAYSVRVDLRVTRRPGLRDLLRGNLHPSDSVITFVAEPPGLAS